jgi:hypothetical protein
MHGTSARAARGAEPCRLCKDIDARFDDLTAVTTAGGGRAIVARLLEEHPDPPDLPPRPYDVHDPREARAAIRRALRRRGR